MIRPLTIVSCLLACGSGLYLYQSKHQVQLLDRTIERSAQETAALREQSRRLATEWTMLNDPERLRRFANTYLSLKTIAPSQFTSLADLGARLPAPQAEVPPPPPDAPAHGVDEHEAVPMASQTVPSTAPDPAVQSKPDADQVAAVAEEALPVPPVPAGSKAPAVASLVQPEPPIGRPAELPATRLPVTRLTESRAPDRVAIVRSPAAEIPAHENVVADAKPLDQRQRTPEQHAASHVTEAQVEVRLPAAPAPRPIVLTPPRSLPNTAHGKPDAVPAGPVMAATQSSRALVATPAPPYSGSLLGMAHGSLPPAPRPTPVEATYNAN